MNTRNLVIGVAVVLWSVAGALVYAQPDQTTQVAVEVGNKICPVSGEEVGEMGEVIKYEYNGKIYNLCCPMCEKDFAKDPEKYSKIAEDEVAANQAGEAR